VAAPNQHVEAARIFLAIRRRAWTTSQAFTKEPHEVDESLISFPSRRLNIPISAAAS